MGLNHAHAKTPSILGAAHANLAPGTPKRVLEGTLTFLLCSTQKYSSFIIRDRTFDIVIQVVQAYSYNCTNSRKVTLLPINPDLTGHNGLKTDLNLNSSACMGNIPSWAGGIAELQ